MVSEREVAGCEGLRGLVVVVGVQLEEAERGG